MSARMFFYVIDLIMIIVVTFLLFYFCDLCRDYFLIWESCESFHCTTALFIVYFQHEHKYSMF